MTTDTTTADTTTAAPGRRPRGRPGHDREAVLRTAIALFNRRGFDATSISDLAAELKVTKSAVYHHFTSKEALLAAALDEALEGLSSAVEAAATATDGERSSVRLRATVEAAVHILVDHLPAVTLLLRVRGNSDLERSALERRRRIDERLSTLVRQAAAEGDLRSDVDPDVISRLVFGMVNSLVDWYRPSGPLHTDALAATISSVLFDGLRPPPDDQATDQVNDQTKDQARRPGQRRAGDRSAGEAKGQAGDRPAGEAKGQVGDQAEDQARRPAEGQAVAAPGAPETPRAPEAPEAPEVSEAPGSPGEPGVLA